MTGFFRRTVMSVCALLIAVTLAWPMDAAAQTLLPSTAEAPSAVPELPDPLTSEAVREVVSRLSDQEVRALLLDRLDAVATAETEEVPTSSGFGMVWTSLVEIGGAIGESVSRGGEVLAGVERGFATFLEPRGWSGFGILVGFTALAVLIGFIAEFLVDRALRAWRGQIVTSAGHHVGADVQAVDQASIFRHDWADHVLFRDAHYSTDIPLQRTALP